MAGIIKHVFHIISQHLLMSMDANLIVTWKSGATVTRQIRHIVLSVSVTHLNRLSPVQTATLQAKLTLQVQCHAQQKVNRQRPVQ